MGMMVNGKEGTKLELNKPSGLGGWLVLVQITLYASIFRLFITIVNYSIPSLQPEIWEVLTSPDSSVYDPLWKPTLIFETAINVGFLLVSCYLLVLMYRKKALFPKVIIFYYITNVLLLIIDYILLANIAMVEQVDLKDAMKEIVKVAISCLIWIPYFIRSRRVHHTFIR